MPANTSDFSTCSVSRSQAAIPDGLLRGIIEQPAHLMRIQARRASRRRRRAEIFRDAVRAAVRLHLTGQAAERHRDARADVIAQRDGAQEAVPVDAELLAGGQRRGHHGAAGVRLRGRVGVVRFIGMGQHPVGQRRFDRAANHVRAGDGGDFLPVCARANWSAMRPGGRSAPEIMAANVSRI